MALNFNPTAQVTRSVAKVPLVSLFNDFGSSMGLWLGVSVFSIYEMAKDFALGMKVGEKWEVLGSGWELAQCSSQKILYCRNELTAWGHDYILPYDPLPTKNK